MQAPRRSQHPPAEPDISLLLTQTMAAMANAILITDRNGYIVWANQAFCELCGYALREVIGKTPRLLRSGTQDAAFYHDLWQTIATGNVWRGELVDQRKDGSLYTIEQTITPLRNASGAITHYVAVQHDITRHKRRGEREHFLAYHDALTGLSNRTRFLDALQQACADAAHTGRALALLYVDIDNFKSINDTLGHDFGDRLLVAVAERLGAAVRKTDTVARLGGDEFAILQAELHDTGVAVSLARKLLRAMARPFVFEGRKVFTSVSIGIALYPRDAEKLEDLLRNADRAMYRAKQQGRNNYKLYGRIGPHIVALEQGLTAATALPPQRRAPRAPARLRDRDRG